jgi:Type II secretion system (T2SS), protein E, N-terminal domain
MPLLGRTTSHDAEAGRAEALARSWSRAAALFPECANPNCASSWLHLWRDREAPIFEDGWNCSEACTRARIQAAIRREMEGRPPFAAAHRHRVPLGLLMLAEGWITQAQLKSALGSQQAGGSARLGECLVRDAGVDERQVTRALSMQWNCPVFTTENLPAEEVAAVAPRLLLEAFGILPIRIAGDRLLYLGFEDRIDRCATLAIERMTGLGVEAGLVHSSEFARKHGALLTSNSFPRTRLIEAVDVDAMTNALTSIVEKTKPAGARLVRMHDCYWLRLWHGGKNVPWHRHRESIEDVLCSIVSLH